MPVLDTEALINERVEAIRLYHQTSKIPRAELDVSGGVDSAVMLGLLAKALGPENITAVYSSIHSSQDSLERAREVAKTFEISLIELDLSSLFDQLTKTMHEALVSAGYDSDTLIQNARENPAITGSIRSCIRAPIGRGLNRMTNGGIRHGTGNECEDRWLRFYQKGGDGEVDTNPLAMLSKGEVYQLAIALKVPESIVNALPSPDLHGVGEQHNDEEELSRLSGGVDWSYSRVDPKTGLYIKIGTIERMSRFFDSYEKRFCRDLFLADSLKHQPFTSGEERALKDFGLTMEHLHSALKWERVTRHKANPNCPALGKRSWLLEEDILSNYFPKGF